MQMINIICPVFNERENLRYFLNAFDQLIDSSKLREKYQFKYFFMDNSSTDGTFAILNNFKKNRNDIEFISYSKNYGVMRSIFTGILNSEEMADAIVVFDCDLQDPPELLLKFIESWESGYLSIFGRRTKRDEPMIYTIFRKAYKKIEKTVGNNIEIESGCWFLDAKIVKKIKNEGKFDPYLPGLLHRYAFKSHYINYTRNTRKYGKSKFNFIKYLEYSRDGLVSGSIGLLRFSLILGAFLIALTFLSCLYFLAAKFIFGKEFQNGIIAIIVITLFLFSSNFFILGIIGEYIGRMYSDRYEPNIADIIYNSRTDEI